MKINKTNNLVKNNILDIKTNLLTESNIKENTIIKDIKHTKNLSTALNDIELNEIKETIKIYIDDIDKYFINDNNNDIQKEIKIEEDEEKLYVNKKYNKHALNGLLNNQKNPFTNNEVYIEKDNENPMNKKYINETEKKTCIII